ncbi:MAG: hypothetical protein H6953_06675 [Chromatiaceae bacterium]|nr:hypothetical protein [Gammaproteobacteria bacterium]MCP5305113.1 hypothetical protein [Chromatiaceae bacterium]MCP5315072.1 hypothetical protein [Chromatiaceae bacterium]
MFRRLFALLSAGALLFVFGCGNKGPLTLPDRDPGAARDKTITEPD